MSSIGFKVQDGNNFLRFADQAILEGEAISVKDGTYVRWSPGNGIELIEIAEKQSVLVGRIDDNFVYRHSHERVSVSGAGTCPGNSGYYAAVRLPVLHVGLITQLSADYCPGSPSVTWPLSISSRRLLEMAKSDKNKSKEKTVYKGSSS